MRRNPFAIIAALLVLAYLIGAFVSAAWSLVILGPVVAAVVLVSAWQNGASMATLRVIGAVCAIAQISLITDAVVNDADEAGIGNAVLAIGLVAAPVLILRQLLQHTRVTSNTIFGAVSVYILLGLAFADVYMAIQRFSDSDFLAEGALTSRAEAQYFSFVTLTTTGFGDLTPAGNGPRSVVVLEALMGQLFLVTLLARLVSLYAGPATGAEHQELRELRELREPRETGPESGRDGRSDGHDPEGG